MMMPSLFLELGEIEDLKVIVLIIYLFEGLSRLAINFRKNNLFFSRFRHIL